MSEITKAVNGRIEVYMDGGVRQGVDVLKALALGAQMVRIHQIMQIVVFSVIPIFIYFVGICWPTNVVGFDLWR